MTKFERVQESTELFQRQVIPFGLHSSCATFLDVVLGQEMDRKASACLDDTIVLDKIFPEILEASRTYCLRTWNCHQPRQNESYPTHVAADVHSLITSFSKSGVLIPKICTRVFINRTAADSDP